MCMELTNIITLEGTIAAQLDIYAPMLIGLFRFGGGFHGLVIVTDKGYIQEVT